MKRYSDNLSPSRWKRICPPADDSDSSDTDDSLDLSFELLSDLWESRTCNRCPMPASSCSCTPRRSINQSSDLPIIIQDSEPRPGTSRASNLGPSLAPSLSGSYGRRAHRRTQLYAAPEEGLSMQPGAHSPEGAGPSIPDMGRSVSFLASTNIETYSRPSRESLPDDSSTRSSASMRRFNEILNQTSLLLDLGLSARSERSNHSLIVEETASPPGRSASPTCIPSGPGVGEALRRESTCTGASNDPSPPEVEVVVNKELEDMHSRLLSLIECPVCLEPIPPPIHQCRRGHLVCAKCRSQLSQCPTCRDKLCETRNWAVERIAELLKYPCRNSGSGCTITTLLSNKAAHEAVCPYRPFSCLFRTCSWTGFQPDLLPHLRSAHPLRFLEGTRHEIDVELSSPTLFITDWAISCFERIFRFNVFQHIPNFMFYASAYLISGSGGAPDAQPSDFKYVVTVSGSQSRKLTYSRETHPDTIRTTQLCHTEDCFVIRGDKLDFFAHSNGTKLRLLVELERAEDPNV